MNEHTREESTTRFGLRLWVAFLLTVFVCAGFTASASLVLLIFYGLNDTIPGAASIPKLWIRLVLFSGVAVGCVVGLRRIRLDLPPPQEHCTHRSAAARRPEVILLLLILALLGVITMIRLERFPHVEPDESHHLIVSRNLAKHGVYASGEPSSGFVRFDRYDSVGPTVLIPVAAGIAVSENPIAGGRRVMAACYLFLTVATYLLVRRNFGELPAFASVSILLAAPGSLYLSRTLYGEVPALSFLLLGTLVWQTALERRSTVLPLLLSGVLFGCALLTKTFLVIALWPALGMWLHDRMGMRRIKVKHAVVPAVMGVGILSAWVMTAAVFGDVAQGASGSSLATYQHNLLFGLTSIDATFGWLAGEPLATVLFLGIGIVGMTALLSLSSHSPALLFLALFAGLNWYWWCFFTTASHPRYLWYSLALGAIFLGALLAHSLRVRFSEKRTLGMVCMIVGALLTLAVAPRLGQILNNDENAGDVALVQFITTNYPRGAIATTQYQVGRILNLLAEVPVRRVRTPDETAGCDVVILGPGDDYSAWHTFAERASFDHYKLMEPQE